MATSTGAAEAQPPFADEELSLLPIGEELQWRKGAFLERASTICASQHLPEWKIPAIAKTLELNFIRLVGDGVSEDEALRHIDHQKFQFIAENQ